MFRTICASSGAVALALVAATPVQAFDAFMQVSHNAVNFSNTMQQTVQDANRMNAIVKRGGRGTGTAARPALGFAAAGAPATAAARPLSYQPSAALERQTIEAFVGRLERNNPQAARAVEPLLERHGYRSEYRRFIRGTPIGENDAADALTMFVVMAYLVANDDMRDVPSAQWTAVRNQFRAALGAQPRFASIETRAALGEEMKLMSAILYGGYDGNKKAGRSRQYADGVARMMRDLGFDVRGMTLDERGLVARA
jgi:hypothetical protein